MQSPPSTLADLRQTLSRIPALPGVYLMMGRENEILYIGKAISLRHRVRSYFQEHAVLHPRTAAMVERVVGVRTIVVSNEVEALILEADLVKRHQPPYNVRLRDDKRFPYLKVTNEPFPRVVFTRMPQDDGARYFGPYTNAHDLRELIDLVRRVFPLRTCREPIDGRRPRPCLQYHIKRCLAPCVGYQTQGDYDATVSEVVLFLNGKQEMLMRRLQAEMAQAAQELNFEGAARLRDRIVAVHRLSERQKVVWRSRLDMDLIAAARAQGQACVEVFLVRGGKLIGQEHFMLDGVQEESDDVLFAAFAQQFYAARSSGMQQEGVPKEILIAAHPAQEPLIETWLSRRKGTRVRILVPQRGPRAEYLRLVQRNAQAHLAAFLAHQEVQDSAQARALTELADALELPGIPRRIECYDISNIQGTNAVASMVVFVEGRARKSEYRKFKIQYDRGPNDFAMMQEALRRRLRYLRRGPGEPAAGQIAKREKFERRPDLLLIDGGKGQLQAVVEILNELDLAGIPVAGLAKEHEWLFVPGQAEPIVLAPNSAALHLVMRLRDEAHRFAVTFHRQRRGRAMVRSALDELAGVGPIRKKRLLAEFGSASGLQRASVEAIAALPGFTPSLAARIKAALGE